MAIGNPVSLTGNISSKTISVTATAGQTLFTVTGGYRINQISVRYPDAYAVASSTTGTSSSGAPSGGYRTYIWDGSGSITF